MKMDIIGASVGVIGIVIGIVVSYYFYRKSLRVKEPCWAVRSNNLIEGYSAKLDNLRILYNDKQIENLTISKILFWNDGRDTIEHKDIETVNRLRIVGIEELKFLDAKILAHNNQSSQCNVKIADSGDCIYLDFDYLDQKQGCVIQVVHTGTSTKDIQIIGDIKGVKSFRNKMPIPKWAIIAEFPLKILRRYRKENSLFVMAVGIVYIGLGVVTFFIPSLNIFTISPSMPPTFASRILPAILLCISGGMVLVMGMNTWRRFGIAPKGLEIFHREWS